MSTTNGRMLGRYQLLFMLGQGGMGEVHLARLTGAAGFEKLCIVKTVLPSLMGDQNFIDRFHHEARVLVQLTHSNIAQVYDMGEAEGGLYMAIEYVPGVDLSRVESRIERQQTTMPIPMALFMGQKINEALGYAHRKVGADGTPLGIVHRDVSPQNVMVSYEGEVKVIDFGLAKSSARSKHTLPSTVMGKLGYMSPEQALARPVDHRSDIFSAGIVVWEMLAGRSMYQGGTMSEMVAQMAVAEVPSLTAVRPEIPAALEQIVARALAKDPSNRYHRADDFARALNEFAVRENMTVGAEDVGNYVRAMCPEEFAAERQLQSRLSVMRKKGSSPEIVPAQEPEPELDGTFVRTPAPSQTASGQAMTAAQKAMSMVAPSTPPQQKAPSIAPRSKSVAPVQVNDDADPPMAPPKSKAPVIIVGLLAFIALAGAGLWFLNQRDDEPVADAPVDAGVKVAVVEPEPVKEPEPQNEPPVVVDTDQPAPTVIDRVKADTVWKVIRKGDEDLVILGKGDKLSEGDRINLVGDEEDDKQRPVYGRGAVLEVKGSIVKLLFDDGAALPSTIYAARDAVARTATPVVKKDPRKDTTATTTAVAQPEPTREPEPTKEPEPVKQVEPVKEAARAPVQLFGYVRMGLASRGKRVVMVGSQNAFPLTNCEVRLPSNMVFKMKRPIQAQEVARVPFGDFKTDPRAPDEQFKNDWAAVYCKEGTGYWKTTYDR